MSNAFDWEQEDKSMAAYLDEQDLLTAAIYDDAQAIAEAELSAQEMEAEYLAYEQEMALERYVADIEAALMLPPEGIEPIIRLRDGNTYVTTVHDDAVTREHAISLSATIAQDLDAELHNTWTETRDGKTAYAVQWILREDEDV